ncbi:hypothetical protein OV450_5715 [Actinobacteria bacterium OV450]|nr:hypothetical protein OV450_5715 [Actinobacteria bacterium OV450]
MPAARTPVPSWRVGVRVSALDQVRMNDVAAKGQVAREQIFDGLLARLDEPAG